MIPEPPRVDAELTFDDALDIVNPLHHLPIAGDIYRDVTGDEISPHARVIGGIVFGGPGGGLGAAVSEAIRAETGHSVGGLAVAYIEGNPPEPRSRPSPEFASVPPPSTITNLQVAEVHVSDDAPLPSGPFTTAELNVLSAERGGAAVMAAVGAAPRESGDFSIGPAVAAAPPVAESAPAPGPAPVATRPETPVVSGPSAMVAPAPAPAAPAPAVPSPALPSNVAVEINAPVSPRAGAAAYAGTVSLGPSGPPVTISSGIDAALTALAISTGGEVIEPDAEDDEETAADLREPGIRADAASTAYLRNHHGAIASYGPRS